MKTTQLMAQYIASKKAQAAIDNKEVPNPNKPMMVRSFFNTGKPSPDRNSIEARAKYKPRITRGKYVSDTKMIKFGKEPKTL